MSKRLELILGIFFLAVAIAVGVHISIVNRQLDNEHAKLQRQVTCNKELTDVLWVRSDARQQVDITTRDAQNALIAYFNDVIEKGSLESNDSHVIDVKDRYIKAIQARNNPDLAMAYPKCSGS